MGLNFLTTSTQYVNISGTSSFNNLAEWTIMGRVRPASVNAARVIADLSITASTNTRAALQVQATGQIGLQARSLDAETLRSLVFAAGLVNGTWYHIAGVTRYGTNGLFQIFLNGALVSAATASFGAATSGAGNSLQAILGADAGLGSGFMDGLMEDVRLYNRALGPDEIATIATSQGHDGINNGRTNMWPMNEFSPGTVATAVGSIVDLGTNPINGTPTNSPTYGDSISSFARKIPNSANIPRRT